MTDIKFQKNKLPILMISVFLIFVFWGYAQIAQAADYYVSTTGNNSNSGTLTQPWGTLQYAADRLRAGDTLYIRGGIYTGYVSFGYVYDGTASNHVRIMSYSGETAIINGDTDGDGRGDTPGQDTGSGLVQIYGDYYDISNLEIRRSGDTGLLILGNHSTASGIYSHHNDGSGIVGAGDYVVIDNCDSYYNSTDNENGVMPISWGVGITLARHYITGATGYGTIRNCRSWNNWGEGISTFESYYNTIEDNEIWDNYTVNLYVSDARYTLVQRNISYYTSGNITQAYTSSQNCIGLGDEGHDPHSSNNTVINNLTMGGDRAIYVGTSNWDGTLVANNTFANVFNRITERGVIYNYGGTSAGGGRLSNNVILQDDTSTPLAVAATSNVTRNYNQWHRTPPSGFGGTGDVIGNPLLFRTGSTAGGLLTADWFRLQATSPAANHATVLSSVTTDYYGTARGSSPDMGAIELVQATACTDNDSDGYGTAGSTGCSGSGTDCNDSNASIHPNATDVCGNGIDEDCSGADSACAPSTLSVTLDTNPLGGGPAPLTGLTMTATVSGTATGTISYYFYCNALNDSSTDPAILGTPAYSGTTTSNTISMPAGRCDTTYSAIGTYIAKVIVQRGGSAAEERRTVGVFNPVPAVDLKIRAEGATDWSDWTVNIDYNARAEIRWTFSGASSCVMSGDWVGTKTAPGQEYTSNFTAARTYIYTLECNSSSGLLTDTVMAVVSPPTLFGSLTAAPNTGTAPLIGSVLTANITGGTAVGTVNYTFYCNRSDSGTNITSNYNYKEDGINPLSLAAPADTCNTIYANPGTYTAKVIIERGGIATEARRTVTVTAPLAPVVDLTATPSGTLSYNTSATLNWTVTNAATSCTGTGSPAWVSASKALPSGTWSTGNLTASTTYTMTCTGPGGTGTNSVTVTVAGPPQPPYVELWARVNEMDFETVTVPHGTSVFLAWNTGDPDPVNCEGYSTPPGNWADSPILGDPAEKNPAGGWDYTGNLVGSSDPLVINQYTFTITCYNSAGVSRSDSVLVNVYPDYEPPIVDLEVRPTDGEYDTSGVNIDYGTSAELMWTVENAVVNTTCEASGDWTGLRSITGGTQLTGNLTESRQYTITCTGPGGTDTDTVTVGVRNAPALNVDLQVRIPDGTYNTGGVTIAYNTNAELMWTVENAVSGTTCQASGDWTGPRPVTGTESTGRRTILSEYTLTCTSPGGTDTDTVRVTVNPPPQATVNLRVSQSGSGNYSSTANIPCNEGVDLQWEVTNAISCVGEGDWGGLKSTDGGNDTFTYLTEDAFYGLRCENAAGESVWSGVNVYVADCPENTPIVFQNPLGQSDFREILDSLSGLIRMIAIGLAAIMIIISGIIIITSIDDRERLNKGKNMLKWALIGLAISLASSFIIGFIEEIAR